jgi:hypothetical protein
MNQRTIHISFGRNDEDLYNEIIKQSKASFVPVSILVRFYLRRSLGYQFSISSNSESPEHYTDSSNEKHPDFTSYIRDAQRNCQET